MTDPVTILSIINGSLGLALKIGTVIHALYDISQKLKQAQLTILSTITECETIQAAWSAIERWASSHPDGTAIESELLERLNKSLLNGQMVISAFEDDLIAWSRKSTNPGFLSRSRIVWEENTFSQHQFRIRGQVAAMTLLLQVINLPSRDARAELLQVEDSTLKLSDESAWTIVNSRASFSTCDNASLMSVESAELVYRPLDFENDLFTARVYKRNYRPTMIKRLFKPERKIPGNDTISQVKTPPVSRIDNVHQPVVTSPLGETHEESLQDYRQELSSLSQALDRYTEDDRIIGESQLFPESTGIQPPQRLRAAQQSGEGDLISDQPPSRAVEPRESILIKKGNTIDPMNSDPAVTTVSKKSGPSSPAMDIGEVKSLDLDEYITRLIDAAYAGKVTKGVCLTIAEIAAICLQAQKVFLSQPALLELDAPVKIVGDIRGQYPDLIRLFEMSGIPPNENFLFLGNYVNRGKQSLETILLLLCYKLKYPENFFLLRGKQECAIVTRVYGFYDECKRRCNIKTWQTFIDTFNTLPFAAIVAEKIFCVHGGLSPSLSHMDDIRNIARPTDVPNYGLLKDLLWSDPAEINYDWEVNERGDSYCFGKKVITQFLERYNFDLVCRADMVVEDGYEFFNDRILVTVFSAPNYGGEFDNWGAVMSVSSELLCSFELLKPLDSSALKSHIKKGRDERNSALNSPLANVNPQSVKQQ